MASYKNAQGVLSGPGTQDTLLSVPAGAEASVRHIRLVNHNADCTVKLWLGGTGDGNLILPQSTILGGGWAEFDGVITLEGGDVLYGEASAASTITWSLYYLEV